MTETEIAWLAGLLEGEGSFYLSKKSPRVRSGSRNQLNVYLGMTDRDVVTRAAYLMDAPSVRRKPDKRPNSADCWACTVTGKRAEQIMRDVRPFMGQRRQSRIDELLSLTNLSHHPREVAA